MSRPVGPKLGRAAAPPIDRGRAAHDAAMAHLGRLQEALYDEDGYDRDLDDMPDVDSAGPYCACDTCDTREALAAAWPHALAHAADILTSATVPLDATRAAMLLREEARKTTLRGLDIPA